jgi:diguanylate cyclase (GGDEF)-like protein
MQRFVILVVLYLTGIYLADKFIHAPGQLALFWPSAGLGFAMVLRYGWRWAGCVAFAVLLAHFPFGQFLPLLPGNGALSPVPPKFIPFSIAANAFGALIGAWYAGNQSFSSAFSLRTGLVQLRGGAIAAGVSAVIGVAGLVYNDMLGGGEPLHALAKWAMGDLLGIIAIAPAFLILTARPSGSPDLPRPSDYATPREKSAWVVLLVLSYALVFFGAKVRGDYALGLVALPMTLLLWAAIRFQIVWTACAVAVTMLYLTSLTGFGLAGFQTPDAPLDSALLLGFLSLLGVVPMVLTAANYESKVAARKILRRATTDSATGLPNRAAFEEATRKALAGPAVPRALVYLDLDNFTLINDTTSHAAGDALIHGIGSLLRARLGMGDQVFRIGGDEFALLLGEPGAGGFEARAEDLVRGIESYRVGWEMHVLNITASVGLVPFVPGTIEYARLLSLTDAACFTAKELGGNRVCLASQEAGETQQRTEAMRWAVRIREAIDQGLFELDCQTITPLHDARGDGRHYEVLLRMQDPASGQRLGPGNFIPAAERFQLGVLLDRHVVELAIGWLESRPDAVQQTSTCAINLTAASLVDENFSQFLHDRVRYGKVPAHKLCFEVTETSAVRDLSRAQALIARMRSLGCTFALDDFGTGFCSFNYLRGLDVDYFKIDGSFVRDLESSPLSMAVIRSITDIAHVLRKQTIAEHTESDAVCVALRTLGVDFAQGYAIAKPVPMREYFALSAPLRSIA